MSCVLLHPVWLPGLMEALPPGDVGTDESPKTQNPCRQVEESRKRKEATAFLAVAPDEQPGNEKGKNRGFVSEESWGCNRVGNA